MVGQALASLDSGSKAVVLHSDLGNGKTVALEMLKVRGVERGYEVYSLVTRGESLFE